MIEPHWLDQVFQNPDNAVNALLINDHFIEAMSKAQLAFHDRTKFEQNNPEMIGSTPAQCARVTFLQLMNNNE